MRGALRGRGAGGEDAPHDSASRVPVAQGGDASPERCFIVTAVARDDPQAQRDRVECEDLGAIAEESRRRVHALAYGEGGRPLHRGTQAPS